ncbi:two-component sensor histidine kinase [Nocardioides gansuensis]|uniref:histidine kinase n=1 Tax=Nocardioides gansuensis TaxID=2138300 RepID=A0A2T8FFP8_9ACTN|nr:sensor histidine kinase [Nocardioides gansuensis]PVG84517.1 two-component sensor histidine kinase [Nocardioides gansuensis]
MTFPWQSFLDEPRVPVAAERRRWDWLLVALVVVGATLEATLRDDLPLPVLSWLVTVGLSPTLLWRRSRPLAMVLIAFGVAIGVDVGSLVAGAPAMEMVSAVWFILLPYALFRWGSGREAAVGIAVILSGAVMGLVVGWTGVGDAIGGSAVLLSSVALGVAVRSQHGARDRRLEQAKADERVLIARELHDTVAHHVSAIAIQAQAGRALAVTSPEASVQALRVIEQEASRALGEMRAMVGVLRNQAAAEYAPQPGVKDLERLAAAAASGPPVRVTLTGDLDGLPAAVDAAVYRIAQEAVTNARRHAHHATAVDVRVAGGDDRVTLTVHDDGEPANATGRGFGITGMVERAALLGGTCRAVPRQQGGWAVEATLPRAVPQ